MTDFARQRFNMVESQVRPNGITDSRLIAAMSEIPREEFVPEHCRSLAYMDEDVPLGAASQGAAQRFLMEPMSFARLAQLAAIKSTDKVLDIGAATGYSTAVLAKLAASVVAVEEDPALVADAQRTLAKTSNITIHHGAHAAGYPAGAPYDVIVLEGRVPAVPDSLLGQLADGGRLVAVVGDQQVARAMLYTRHDGAISSRPAYDAWVAPLPGVTIAGPAFVFQ